MERPPASRVTQTSEQTRPSARCVVPKSARRPPPSNRSCTHTRPKGRKGCRKQATTRAAPAPSDPSPPPPGCLCPHFPRPPADAASFLTGLETARTRVIWGSGKAERIYCLASEGGPKITGLRRGGGGSPWENFAGEILPQISPLRKVAKFSPGEISAEQLHPAPPLRNSSILHHCCGTAPSCTTAAEQLHPAPPLRNSSILRHRCGTAPSCTTAAEQLHPAPPLRNSSILHHRCGTAPSCTTAAEQLHPAPPLRNSSILHHRCRQCVS